MKYFLIFVLCVTSVLALPQRFQDFPFDNNFFFPDNGNNERNRVTTTAAPSTTAATNEADSPQYIRCFQSCPSTMEYNPICGTDRQNYHNMGRLGCAQRCGKNVAAVRSGICTT